jgi:Do/DeqQ family serine protease
MHVTLVFLKGQPKISARARQFALSACAVLAFFFLTANHGVAQTLFGGSLSNMVERTAPAVVNSSVVTQLAKPISPLANDPVLGPLIPGQYRFDVGGGAGSGVIIDAARGIVVTNHHVIERARSIKVILRDRREYDAKLVGADPATDIAVIRIAPENLTAMTIANSDRVRIGDTVVAIGNPFGLGQTVTAGIVSALGRSMNMEGYEEYIQTDATINPGNSGGALTNTQGELVGINTAGLTPPGRQGNTGIGFAVPTNMMSAVVEQILRYGEVRRGKAGLSGEDVTPGLAKTRGLNVTEGALITRIDTGSSAQKSGVRPGDVVTAVNGKPVASQAALRNRLALVAAGESVELEYLRGGTKATTRVEITPIAPGVAKSSDVDIPQLPGARLGNHAEGGVAVSTVDSASISHEMGLRGGDIIDSMNRQPVANLAVFRRVMEKAEFAVLGIIRGDSKVQLRYRASY